MDRQTALDRLRAREGELRAMGVMGLSLFGSVARGEAGPGSDVDVAVTLDYARGIDLFDFIVMQDRIGDVLGVRADLVTEPARKPAFRAEIERDRVHVF